MTTKKTAISTWKISKGKKIIFVGEPCSRKMLMNMVSEALEERGEEGTFNLSFEGTNGEMIIQEVIVKKQYTVDFGE
ncbi:MAG: hypothetical protein PHW73_04070 [Atribacterota bacterium]|nr:hypothetical protein [Atribacterota bacterium]